MNYHKYSNTYRLQYTIFNFSLHLSEILHNMSGTERVDLVTVPNNDVDIRGRAFNDKPLNVPGNDLTDYVMNEMSDAELAYLKPFNDLEERGWYKKK